MNVILLIVLILFILGAFGGGFYADPAGAYPYRTGGWGLGSVLLVILIIMLLTGRL